MTQTSSNESVKLPLTCDILDKLMDAVKAFDSHTTTIFLGHPLDLLTLDMKLFSPDCYFISDLEINRGELRKINEGLVKEELYKFVKNNPDRVFRGEREYV